MLLHMEIQHKVEEGTLQAGTQPLIEGKAAASHLCCSAEIQDIQFFPDIPVGFGGKAEFGRLAPTPYFPVISITCPRRHGFMRDIGQGKQNLSQLFVNIPYLIIQFLNNG
jgi:hypothetical protein